MGDVLRLDGLDDLTTSTNKNLRQHAEEIRKDRERVEAKYGYPIFEMNVTDEIGEKYGIPKILANRSKASRRAIITAGPNVGGTGDIKFLGQTSVTATPTNVNSMVVQAKPVLQAAPLQAKPPASTAVQAQPRAVRPLKFKWFQTVAGVPEKPTREKMSRFASNVASEVMARNAARPELISAQASQLEAESNKNAAMAKSYLSKVQQTETKARTVNATELEKMRNLEFAYGMQFMRTTSRAAKLKMAASVLRTAAREKDATARAALVASANLLREVPTPIKVPKEVADIAKSEAQSKEIIDNQGVSPVEKMYRLATGMPGFGDAATDVRNWFQTEGANLGKALASTALTFGSDQLNKYVAKGQQKLGVQQQQAVQQAVTDSKQQVVTQLQPQFDTALQEQGSGAPPAEKSGGIPSWVLPVALFLGGAVVVTILIR